MAIDTLELAKQLIARQSVTPEDAGCLDLLTGLLEPLGFVCEKISMGGVDNLWARRGNSGPVICFAGHSRWASSTLTPWRFSDADPTRFEYLPETMPSSLPRLLWAAPEQSLRLLMYVHLFLRR